MASSLANIQSHVRASGGVEISFCLFFFFFFFFFSNQANHSLPFSYQLILNIDLPIYLHTFLEKKKPVSPV